MTLFDQLLDYARSRRPKAPRINLNLWEAAEQVRELRTIIEQLTIEVEMLKSQQIEPALKAVVSQLTTLTNELNHLKLRIAVLEGHEEHRRRTGNG